MILIEVESVHEVEENNQEMARYLRNQEVQGYSFDYENDARDNAKKYLKIVKDVLRKIDRKYA